MVMRVCPAKNRTWVLLGSKSGHVYSLGAKRRRLVPGTKVTQGANQLEEDESDHDGTDAACGEACLVADAIRLREVSPSSMNRGFLSARGR